MHLKNMFLNASNSNSCILFPQIKARSQIMAWRHGKFKAPNKVQETKIRVHLHHLNFIKSTL